MKIAIIGCRGYPYVYSGYETFVKELSERLAQDMDVTVYCHKNLFKNRTRRVNNINLVYIPTIERKALAQFIHSMQSMMHACFKKYDIILVVNAANGPFGLFTKLFRKKTAINVDGLEWLRPKWRGLGARYFYWAAKLAVKLYDKVITDSLAMQKIYEKEFGASSVLISYGANIRYSQNKELIKRWGLEEGGYYLVVGRLIPDNNADLIIREFISSRSIKKLVIVGDVPYRDSFADKMKETGNNKIIFTGYVNEEKILEELYLNCFAYIHGHEFGGTNPALLTALGCGSAAVALDTVFNREVLIDQEYGILFDKVPQALKGIMEALEANPALLEPYRQKARERVKEYYNWEKIAAEYKDLFCRSMAGA